MREYFYISGYFKADTDDERHYFDNEVVTNFDDEPEDVDELPFEIFEFGWNEISLIEAVKLGESETSDMVITSYERIKNL